MWKATMSGFQFMKRLLNIESEMHYITVLNDVFLSLYAHLTGFAHSSFTAVFDIVIVFYHLSTDETLLEIRMDDAGTLGSLPSLAERPCGTSKPSPPSRLP